MKKDEHLVIVPNDDTLFILECKICHQKFTAQFPISCDMFLVTCKQFRKEHKNCVKK